MPSAADPPARGDIREGSAAVMRKLGPSVYVLLAKLVRGLGDAADKALSLFAEKVCKYTGTCRGDGSLGARVYALARNSAVTATRDGWRRRGGDWRGARPRTWPRTFAPVPPSGASASQACSTRCHTLSTQ